MIRIFMIGMSDNKGGVEAYIHNLVSKMDSSEYEIVYQLPEMELNGKKWIMPKNRHHYIKYRKFWKSFFKENPFDVLYFNTCDIMSIDPLIFAKQAGIPVRIIHSHSSGVEMNYIGRFGFVHKIFEKTSRKNLMKYATDLFACSEVAGEWMFGDEAFRVIKNGIDIEKYQFNGKNAKKCKESIGLSDDERVVGCIGRLVPVKNIPFVLDIAQIMKEQKKSVKFVIIGDGECRAELETKVKEKELQQSVFFTGAVDNVNEWFSAIDCILMPSLFEGLPFVLVEAQAAGIHSVVSSAVSKEADLTGLVHFYDLEESQEIWSAAIMKYIDAPREETKQQLEAAGYLADKTTKEVCKIIKHRIGADQ